MPNYHNYEKTLDSDDSLRGAKLPIHPSLAHLFEYSNSHALIDKTPLLRFTYQYAYPFNMVCLGFLKKWDFESRLSLTSLSSID